LGWGLYDWEFSQEMVYIGIILLIENASKLFFKEISSTKQENVSKWQFLHGFSTTFLTFGNVQPELRIKNNFI